MKRLVRFLRLIRLIRLISFIRFKKFKKFKRRLDSNTVIFIYASDNFKSINFLSF